MVDDNHWHDVCDELGEADPDSDPDFDPETTCLPGDEDEDVP